MEVSYGVSRNANETGRVEDAPKCMLIRLVLLPLEGDEFNLLYDWAFKDNEIDTGTISFRFKDGGAIARQVVFYSGKCIGFKEQFLTQTRSTFREYEQVNIPNRREYAPSYRGRSYFNLGEYLTGFYELIVKAQRIEIGQVTIEG